MSSGSLFIVTIAWKNTNIPQSERGRVNSGIFTPVSSIYIYFAIADIINYQKLSDLQNNINLLPYCSGGQKSEKVSLS